MMAKKMFTWPVDLEGAAATHAFDVRSVQLGDGYEQRQKKFLRPKRQTWDVQKTGKKALIDEISAFFDACGGVESFWWQPPGKPRVLVKVAEYRETPKGGDVYQLSWKFEEVYA